MSAGIQVTATQDENNLKVEPDLYNLLSLTTINEILQRIDKLSKVNIAPYNNDSLL